MDSMYNGCFSLRPDPNTCAGINLNRRRFCLSTSALAFAAIANPARALAQLNVIWPVPPQVARRPEKVGIFGTTRTDEYAWLKTQNWQLVLRDPEKLEPAIRAVIDAETAYSDAMLAPTKDLQAKLRARAAAVVPAAAHPLKVARSGFYYYTREAPGSAYPIYLRQPLAGGPEQIVLDPAERAKNEKFYAIGSGGAVASPDGARVGWAEDLAGSGQFRIRVKEIASGHMVVNDIDHAHGEFAFDANGNFLFWVGRGPTGVADSVWRRDIASGTDIKILAEGDPSFFVDLHTTASGDFVVIRLFNGAQAENYLIPAADPTSTPTLVEARAPELRYSVDHWNGQLIILTDVDGASDMKIMTAPIATPGRAQWKELVAHQPGRFIAAIHPFKKHLVREEWRDAHPRLVVMDLNGGERDASFDEPAYALIVPAGQDWNVDALVFSFQSPRLPPQPQRLLLDSAKIQAKTVPLRKAYNPAGYRVERIEAVSLDGTRVPITLLSARGATRDGKAPLYLYGYGSYGATVPADFQPSAIALVDEGWTFAIAHIRGGAERGSDWWRSVLKTGKKKSFEDFIACAEHLIAHGYTAKGRIVAQGFSAGGLVMGAVAVQRPDLWAGVIGRMPFVDPLNELDMFESHPLGKTALPIWGDPRIKSEYDYIASYSPYDNLKAEAYPALLMLGSLTDDRVMYTDPLKFAIKARAYTTAGNPIMARIASAGGHGGPPGLAAGLERDAMYHAFAIWAADRKWGDVPQR